MKTLLFLLLLFSQFANAQFEYQENDKLFVEIYKSIVPKDEKLENAWMYYIKTKLKNGKYAVRTIFPGPKQIITSYIEYKDKKCKEKHGKALYWKDDGSVYKIGAFKNNQLTGHWIYYSPRYNELSSEGTYVDGKKEGVWKLYNEKKFLSHKLNYKNDKKEGEFEQYDSLGIIINKGEYRMDTVYQESNSDLFNFNKADKPLFDFECKNVIDLKDKSSCSEKSLFKYLGANLKYPIIAREYGIEGKVFVYFVVDKEGKIKDIVIPNGFCQEIKDEVYNLVFNMPDWNPGEYKGKKINANYTLPIMFKLE